MANKKNQSMNQPKNPSNTNDATTPVKTCSLNSTDSCETSEWKFKANSNYFSIVIYGLLFVALATCIFMGITHWNGMMNKVGAILSTLRPFVIAFFIAYILNPFVKYIDSKLKTYVFKARFVKARKLTSIALSYVIVLISIGITIRYITPELLSTISDIEKKYSSINIAEIENKITQLFNEVQLNFPGIEINSIGNKINEFIPHVFSYGTELITNLLSISVSIVKTLINIVLAIVISCYMLADKNALRLNAIRTLYSIFSKQKAASIIETASECNSIFSKFIIGKSIDSLIIGLICFVAMLILKLDYAIFLSIIVGITNMIPYFGPFIGAIPGVIIYLFINPIQALIFAIMIFALQQFDGLYLGPKILGGSTGLTPLWVIFGITVGGAYFGVFGMFVGVPIVAVIAYLLNKGINNRLKKKGVIIPPQDME